MVSNDDDGKYEEKEPSTLGKLQCSLWCPHNLIRILSLSPSVHQNYVGTDAEKNPFYLSVVLSDQNNQRVPQYRAILWRKTVSSTPSLLTTVVEEVKNCFKCFHVVLLSVLATWLPLAGVRIPVNLENSNLSAMKRQTITAGPVNMHSVEFPQLSGVSDWGKACLFLFLVLFCNSAFIIHQKNLARWQTESESVLTSEW